MGKWWFGTLNNYTELEWIGMKAYKCDYCVIGKEVGKQGTPHLQFVFKFHSDKKLEVLKKAFSRAHWEPCKSPKDTIEYCKKDGDFYQYGKEEDATTQGQRHDLITLGQMIMQNNADIEEIANACPEMIIKYSKGIDRLLEIKNKPLMRENRITWIYGMAGVGKTKTVFDRHHIDDIYIKNHTKWWNGYIKQNCIVLDDFDGRMPFKEFLTLTDRYPMSVEYKGGFISLKSAHIYITSDKHPREVYNNPNDPNIYAQVERRIDEIIHIKEEVGGNTNAPTLKN